MDIYPSKAQFSTNETVTLCLICDDVLPISVHIRVLLLSKTVWEQNIVLTENKTTVSIGAFSATFAGYGVNVYQQNDLEKPILQTAFDVAESPRKLLRYGFLSDFTEKDRDNGALEWLLKCHINLVQFYDWSYRHDSLVAPQEDYHDMMGKEISGSTVKAKIAKAKALGMHPTAYGAVYAASKPFFEKHPTWAFYNSCQEPFVFIDVFYIMNIAEGSPWRKHLFEEYQNAISMMGFSGIHMDTYGFPKTAYSHLDAIPKKIKLEDELPTLIDETRKNVHGEEEPYLIFNNVGAWPVQRTADRKQDAVYIEVWPPYDRYASIAQLIRDARTYAKDDKSIILAAYLKPFREGKREKALPAARLLMGSIVSNGATHLLTGENQTALTQGYYSDYTKFSDSEAEAIRRYYDYMIRYENLFFDPELQDVTMTHTGWDNYEYQCTSHKVSSYGEAGKIWMILREKDYRKCIYLLNLCGQSEDYWNEGKEEPNIQKDIKFTVQVDTPVEKICFSTPDGKNMDAVELLFTERATRTGKFIDFTVPSLNYWTTIWIDTRKETI